MTPASTPPSNDGSQNAVGSSSQAATAPANASTSNSSQNAPPQADFELEFYKLHRAHEVALNNAQAANEQSVLRLFLVLNAVSIGAFATLIQSVREDSPITYEFDRGIWAIYLWSVGVGLASIATFLWYLSQRAFTMAYRARRQAEEARRAGPKDPTWPGKYGIILKGECPNDPKGVANRLCDDADDHRKRAGTLQNWAVGFGVLAGVAAVAGFYFAITSVRNVPERAQLPLAPQAKAFRR